MFPFDHSSATAGYLVWYLLTLVLHVLPMNYVLAGSSYLACFGVWEALRGEDPRQQPIAAVLRDWMPFALGVAITAGVAPLLFIQILYRREFYTANLLLFHRWMAILPVLIAAFYLLYLQKSKRFTMWPAAARAAVSVGIVCCFAFVAWSWTENHLLSLRGQQVWAAEYLARNWFYRDPELFPRLSIWYLGAFPALATVLGGQFLLAARGLPESTADAERTRGISRTLAVLALSGFLGAGAAAAAYYGLLPSDVRDRLLQPDALAFGGLAVGGVVVQAAAWLMVWRAGRMSNKTFAVVAIGLVAATTGATLIRELRRVAAVGLRQSAELHEAAARIGGERLFIGFLVVNTVVIVGLVVLIRRGLRQTDRSEHGAGPTAR